jgi:hypothetical protein
VKPKLTSHNEAVGGDKVPDLAEVQSDSSDGEEGAVQQNQGSLQKLQPVELK